MKIRNEHKKKCTQNVKKMIVRFDLLPFFPKAISNLLFGRSSDSLPYLNAFPKF